MTGFGRGAAREGAVEATVEVRSVNARFVDVSVHAPRFLATYERKIQRIAKEKLSRGKVSVSVSLKEDGSLAVSSMDAGAVRNRMALLRAVREEAQLTPEEAPITLELLLQNETLTADEGENSDRTEAAWRATDTALREALTALETMSRQEGEALKLDLEERAVAIEASLDAIEKRAPERVKEAGERLQEKLSELLADERLNANRLEMEVALLADKLDVTEECVRLRSHLGQFREALSSEGSIGRRLNFLSQELNREINTIGSKANDSEITRLSVAMKEELEKIREQVQNVV